MRGSYAYVIPDAEGLQVVDISQPEKPKEAIFFPLPARGLSIGLSEDFAVVSTKWNGYFFIDISRPERPQLAANIYIPRGSSEFKLEENRLYAASQSFGINVIPLPLKNIGASRFSDHALTFEKPQFPGWYDLSVGGGKKLVTVASALKVD